MEFSSFPFIFRFLPLFLMAYYMVPESYKNFVLFFGSIVYYAFINLPCTPVILVIIGLNYLIAKKMQKGSKTILALGLIFNIAALVFFKIGLYSMPGISFLSFQMIAFQIDSYRGNIEGMQGFGTFAIMFPKLISGPITRFNDIKAVLTGRKPISENLESGLELFVLGLSYKVLLADRLAGLWNAIQKIGFEIQ